MSARLATTVLLLRGGHERLEVFMVQRHRKSGFLPNAWVFPGGRVDAADRMAGHPALVGGQEVLSQLDIPHADAVAHVVAGLRETWEEVGIWLGEGAPDADFRQQVATGKRSLESVLSPESRLRLDALRAWSWWVTPEAEPKRYDTRFLITLAETADGRHDDHETVDSRWVSPKAILDATDPQGFPLAPPTWFTLAELAQYASANDAYAAAKDRVQAPIQPVMQFADHGMTLLMPGHPEHPDGRIPGVPSHITFEGGRWVAHG
jgi:8-oxo-dGTP pyrophosphatase MutT (NUDIX family)